MMGCFIKFEKVDDGVRLEFMDRVLIVKESELLFVLHYILFGDSED